MINYKHELIKIMLKNRKEGLKNKDVPEYKDALLKFKISKNKDAFIDRINQVIQKTNMKDMNTQFDSIEDVFKADRNIRKKLLTISEKNNNKSDKLKNTNKELLNELDKVKEKATETQAVNLVVNSNKNLKEKENDLKKVKKHIKNEDVKNKVKKIEDKIHKTNETIEDKNKKLMEKDNEKIQKNEKNLQEKIDNSIKKEKEEEKKQEDKLPPTPGLGKKIPPPPGYLIPRKIPPPPGITKKRSNAQESAWDKEIKLEEDYIKDIKFYDEQSNQIKSLKDIQGGRIQEKIMTVNQLDFTDNDNKIKDVIEKIAMKINHQVVENASEESHRNIQNEWVKCDSQCSKQLKNLFKQELELTVFILRVLSASLIDSSKDKRFPMVFRCLPDNVQHLNGIWDHDKDLIQIYFHPEERTREKKLIYGFGPSASGKTFWAEKVIDLMETTNPNLSKSFVSIDGGIIRDKSVMYKHVVKMAHQQGLGFNNLVVAGVSLKKSMFSSGSVKKAMLKFLEEESSRFDYNKLSLYIPETASNIGKVEKADKTYKLITGDPAPTSLLIWQHVNEANFCNKKFKIFGTGKWSCMCDFQEGFKCVGTKISGELRSQEEGKQYSPDAWKTSMVNGKKMLRKSLGSRIMIHNSGAPGNKSTIIEEGVAGEYLLDNEGSIKLIEKYGGVYKKASHDPKEKMPAQKKRWEKEKKQRLKLPTKANSQDIWKKELTNMELKTKEGGPTTAESLKKKNPDMNLIPIEKKQQQVKEDQEKKLQEAMTDAVNPQRQEPKPPTGLPPPPLPAPLPMDQVSELTPESEQKSRDPTPPPPKRNPPPRKSSINQPSGDQGEPLADQGIQKRVAIHPKRKKMMTKKGKKADTAQDMIKAAAVNRRKKTIKNNNKKGGKKRKRTRKKKRSRKKKK